MPSGTVLLIPSLDPLESLLASPKALNRNRLRFKKGSKETKEKKINNVEILKTCPFNGYRGASLKR